MCNVATFCANPTKEYWAAVKRAMRYLTGTLFLGLLYRKTEVNNCLGFSDVERAGELIANQLPVTYFT